MYKETAKEKFNSLVKNHAHSDIVILAIETSCDETAIAVVKNGTQVLSNVISSQIEIHKRFGGVVPEVASRNHLLAIDNVLKESLEKAKVTLQDIHAVAVTYGAGLAGALLVGVNYAKALAYSLEIPLLYINHIKGHISANYIAHPELKPPYLGLVVSGGHTALVKVKNYTTNELIGTTVDDAIGEAYDKVAKVLGLGYPGGPIIDKTAKTGSPEIKFIKGEPLKNTFNFSYSGLKTSVINYIHNQRQKSQDLNIANICASFQEEAVNQLVVKTIRAAKKYRLKNIVVAGGVAANHVLREKLAAEGKAVNKQVWLPPMVLCTDNAAMIGAEAYYCLINGEGLADLTLTAEPGLHLKNLAKKK